MGRMLDGRGHLLRVAGLFAAGLVLFLIVRALLVPEDFGLYGHFRAGALEDNRRLPLVHAGRAACLDCHGDAGSVLAGGAHGEIGCEACHGPLGAHAASPEEMLPARPDSANCLFCHESLAARPAGFPQIDPVSHAGGDPCLDCHAAHAPGL